ncbi:hypothetical protein P170DRAFT_379305 [Aspergillus steynii IBT 23096]|uniref:Impact N-terminal domain-containing protein n=1 Tax=Aspergillus steynii IBT 23096 TaxID=1392250 RepID=A0A2I2GJF1_9EURO|nr:uncharacterized protein P170DRAFT_379305 [Aspergillus steynii IBT 23096]PLB52977.1 hypothetical protein P170DRAFT_379305 [Aspergillus steynii IBT 23096]
MATTQVQTLLRFLSQDAKIPLATAMSKVMALQKSGLTTAEQISKAEFKTLQDIFKDDKLAKQAFNSAKRVSKKRAAPTEGASSPQKKTKGPVKKEETVPFETERLLSLPMSSAADNELSNVVILTNRAPLVLAFAVSVLRHTMPEQPVSSRLSLAQAVVSANSRSKAVSIGITSGDSAEQEGWGEGQPVIKILGREIKVLKRWDYNPREGQPPEEDCTSKDATLPGNPDEVFGQYTSDESEATPPLWGIDLEALRGTQNSTSQSPETKSALPIFTPNSARSYLYRSFTVARDQNTEGKGKSEQKSKSEIEGEKEECLGHLLRSIDMVCRSWAPFLDKDDLDRRAWAWYLHVRPPVQGGVGGWGEKGLVRLSDILALRRQP